MGIAPKLSKLGPVVMLGWSWAQIDTDSPRISDAHGHPGHVQHCPTSDPLALASHQVGPKVRTTWGRLLNTKNAENSSHVGPKRRFGRIGTMLGWSAQRANYHSPVHFLAAAILKMAPPRWSCTRPTDRSIRRVQTTTPRHLRCRQTPFPTFLHHFAFCIPILKQNLAVQVGKARNKRFMPSGCSECTL